MIPAHIVQVKSLVPFTNLGSRKLNLLEVPEPGHIFTVLLSSIVYKDAKRQKGDKSGLYRKPWLVAWPGIRSWKKMRELGRRRRIPRPWCCRHGPSLPSPSSLLRPVRFCAVRQHLHPTVAGCGKSEVFMFLFFVFFSLNDSF